MMSIQVGDFVLFNAPTWIMVAIIGVVCCFVAHYFDENEHSKSIGSVGFKVMWRSTLTFVLFSVAVIYLLFS